MSWLTEQGLQCFTGTVEEKYAEFCIVQLSKGPNNRLTISLAKTDFLGATANKTAFESLQIGTSVNTWTERESNKVKYASINYK